MNIICNRPVNKPGRMPKCTRIREINGDHEGECDSPYYFTADDREVERVDAPCDHPRCDGGPCRAYSAETLKVTDADVELAKKLVADGWWSTSRKECSIARWKERVPTVEELFHPEILETFHGQRLAGFVRTYRMHQQYGEFVRNEEHIERAILSPSLFRAFKAAGGDCAR